MDAGAAGISCSERPYKCRVSGYRCPPDILQRDLERERDLFAGLQASATAVPAGKRPDRRCNIVVRVKKSKSDRDFSCFLLLKRQHKAVCIKGERFFRFQQFPHHPAGKVPTARGRLAVRSDPMLCGSARCEPSRVDTGAGSNGQPDGVPVIVQIHRNIPRPFNASEVIRFVPCDAPIDAVQANVASSDRQRRFRSRCDALLPVRPAIKIFCVPERRQIRLIPS